MQVVPSPPSGPRVQRFSDFSASFSLRPRSKCQDIARGPPPSRTPGPFDAASGPAGDSSGSRRHADEHNGPRLRHLESARSSAPTLRVEHSTTNADAKTTNTRIDWKTRLSTRLARTARVGVAEWPVAAADAAATSSSGALRPLLLLRQRRIHRRHRPIGRKRRPVFCRACALATSGPRAFFPLVPASAPPPGDPPPPLVAADAPPRPAGPSARADVAAEEVAVKTPEAAEGFIEEYRKHPCLWNPDAADYMKHKPRFKAYEDIAKAMQYPGLDAASVRSKIKILRSCYISSRKQIASKAGTSTPHKPVDWFWAADSFLHDVIRLGFNEPDSINDEYRYLKQNFNTNDPTPDNRIYLELDDDQLMAIENGEMSIEEIAAKAEAAAASQQQRASIRQTPKPTPQRKPKNSNSAQTPARATPARQADKQVERKTQKKPSAEEKGEEVQSAESEPEDEFDVFGRCVAFQLKALPVDMALDLESQIHTLITKKRMDLLRKNKLHTHSQSDPAFAAV
ncbi:unnamed protein product [Nesidiocoris tenuis]|uniref:MADF domain-containing protein n=1 Tax=Nesidiocoris tenuis TaxID=355587 RepID=A0A6H5GUR1_9HEMI|nr:unnamed protein product [Nesidiocoris tenuis]